MDQSVREKFQPFKEEIAGFCRRHHIRKLAVFGSALGGRFHAESDIDLLAEFEPGHVPGLIKLSGMEIELGEIIGWKIDLRTAEDLSRYFREEVTESAEALYA
ncbi:MAG: nucleotidyltransferase [Nitrospinae bacterium CG11_big_fil_rev_8_21_14_0_20_56_8]|nr:MAG: nucleotidyltransferase [Nitrospinae bacterium CG11_big_fil_rev_8_21_14_0_20_56_8]